MVMAREQFLARDHYRPLADLIAARAARHDDRGRPGMVVDLAGGTGYYLSAVLDRLPHRSGLCVDLSAPALRRAARAHPRAAAVGADVWNWLPIDAAAASIVITVFGPRNAAEIERILTSGGVLITASPTLEHLHELIDVLGMVSVDRRKPQRQAVAFNRFHLVDTETLTYGLSLNQRDVAAIAGMGPTARHIPADAISTRVSALPDPMQVTVSVQMTTYRRTVAPSPRLAAGDL
jgi:23S rRNA (guanine745-N1)-methyltransferase